jgi:hypothetical protein
MERRRFKQTSPLDLRLEEQAKLLRKEAQGTPPGIERDKLIRGARRVEIAAHLQQWLTSPGLKSPT